MAESLKTYCKDCHIPIVFLKTPGGKNIPIEWDSLEPDERQSCLMGMLVPFKKRIKPDNTGFYHIPHFHKKD